MKCSLEQKCKIYRTKFFDRDNPSVKGNWKLLISLKTQYPGQICDNPIAVEGQLINENEPYKRFDLRKQKAEKLTFKILQRL